MKKIKLRLVVEVTYIPRGVLTAQLREMLEGVVSYAMSRGLVTGETEAEVDLYTHRVETVPTSKIAVSAPLRRFFEAEIRNEEHGGVRPACLGSARESWVQAPQDTRAGWCGFATDLRLEASLGKVEKELDLLISEFGPDVPLQTILN